MAKKWEAYGQVNTDDEVQNNGDIKLLIKQY